MSVCAPSPNATRIMRRRGTVILSLFVLITALQLAWIE
jgi:hypothetical protein